MIRAYTYACACAYERIRTNIERCTRDYVDLLTFFCYR